MRMSWVLTSVVALGLGCGASGKSELETACEGGDAVSCAKFGAAAIDANENLAGARTALEMACPSIPQACGNLGKLLMDPDFAIEPDPTAARAAWESGCKASDMSSCGNLGAVFLDGVGGQQDLARGRQLSELACGAKDLDYADFCGNLGMYRVQGLGGATDIGGARTAFVKACEAGHTRSCGPAGDMLVKGLGGPADEAAGRAMIQKACDGGIQAACDAL